MRRHILTVVIALLGGFMGAYCFALTDAETEGHSPGSDYFTDVVADSPHNDDIGFARELGITMGFSADTYGSDFPVRRDQMASFQMRDLAAAVVLGIQLAAIQEDLMDPPDPWYGLENQERADLLRWAALLLDHEARTRPVDAIGGARMYSYLSENFRLCAQAIDPHFDTVE